MGYNPRSSDLFHLFSNRELKRVVSGGWGGQNKRKDCVRVGPVEQEIHVGTSCVPVARVCNAEDLPRKGGVEAQNSFLVYQ